MVCLIVFFLRNFDPGMCNLTDTHTQAMNLTDNSFPEYLLFPFYVIFVWNFSENGLNVTVVLKTLFKLDY
jgi:uncharacterized Rmd1/YagE family protein